MLPYLGDETRRLPSARAGREQLETQFAADKAALDRLGEAWSDEANELSDPNESRR